MEILMIKGNIKMKCFAAVCLILAAVLLCGGCHGQALETETALPPVETAMETEAATVSGEVEKVKYIYETKYVDFAFVTDEQKQAWLEPLTSLLNNEERMVFDKSTGDHLYDEILYPDRPCIARGYDLALFDFNTDGTPELIVDAGGGSAGNAFYYVYDIMTGEEIGTLNGGFDDSWCIYFHRGLGKYESIGHFEWRYGWMGKSRMVHRAEIGETVGGSEAYLHESSLMSAYYEINAVILDVGEEDLDKGYEGVWQDIYTGVSFSVNGDDATIEEYFDAQDNFLEKYTRIAETGVQLIAWNDVTEYEDDVATKARKMAEALISSEQKFVVGLPTDGADS